MTIDVGQVASIGRGAMASAIATSGTRVDVLADEDDQDSTVDFDTLEITNTATPESETLSDLPVLLVAEGADGQPVGRDRERYPTTYRAVFLPAVSGIDEGMVLLVKECPNAELVNGRLFVFEVVDDPLAIGLTVRARRL